MAREFEVLLCYSVRLWVPSETCHWRFSFAKRCEWALGSRDRRKKKRRHCTEVVAKKVAANFKEMGILFTLQWSELILNVN